MVAGDGGRRRRREGMLGGECYSALSWKLWARGQVYAE